MLHHSHRLWRCFYLERGTCCRGDSMLSYQEDVLKEALNRLPGPLRIVFAASCAQRLMGVYRASTERMCAPAAGLETALAYVWTHLGERLRREEAEQVLADVMALIPDEDAPGWNPLTSYAADAASAVAYALRCLMSSDAQEAAWAARRVYEALEHYVSSRNCMGPGDAASEGRILGAPIIQAGLRRQNRDLNDLQSAGALNPGIIKISRRAAQSIKLWCWQVDLLLAEVIRDTAGCVCGTFAARSAAKNPHTLRYFS